MIDTIRAITNTSRKISLMLFTVWRIHECMRTLDLIGQKFGYGTVIKFVGHGTRGQTIKRKTRLWELTCICGNNFQACTESLRCGDIISCGCSKTKFHNNERYDSGKPKSITRIIKNIKNDAKRRGHLFLLTNDFLLDLFNKQNGKCKLSGKTISFNSPCSASLDRIDSSKDYTEDNVQWVHRTINYMKNTLSVKQFVELCGEIFYHNQKSLALSDVEQLEPLPNLSA